MKRARLAAAILAAAAIILSAPFISLIRNAIRDSFPGHFVLILGAAVGGSIVVALILAAGRIKDRRALRYGGMAAAIVVGTVYSLWTSSPDPQVSAVERFHFVEYGFLTFLFYRAWRPLNDAGVLVLPALAAMLTATIEEWFQWFIPGRVGTMDDVFLNWVAIVCGLLFSIGLDPPEHAVRRIGSRSRQHIGITTSSFVIVFGMFFDSVHLGHRIRDARIGSFASLFTVAELQDQARDRAARWPTEPPIDKTRLAREDQYRTEGVQHIQERNTAWERGDIDTAWRENAILEMYYAPVLDTGHRWPAEQRQDAEQRVDVDGADGSVYISRAYPYDVYAGSRGKFWGATIGLAGVILVLARRSS